MDSHIAECIVVKTRATGRVQKATTRELWACHAWQPSPAPAEWKSTQLPVEHHVVNMYLNVYCWMSYACDVVALMFNMYTDWYNGFYWPLNACLDPW